MDRNSGGAVSTAHNENCMLGATKVAPPILQRRCEGVPEAIKQPNNGRLLHVLRMLAMTIGIVFNLLSAI